MNRKSTKPKPAPAPALPDPDKDRRLFLSQCREKIESARRLAERSTILGLPILAEFWHEVAHMIDIGLSKQENVLLKRKIT